MKKNITAEIIERRGRVMRVKFSDGLIGIMSLGDFPIGSKISITIEEQICRFDKNKIWPALVT